MPGYPLTTWLRPLLTLVALAGVLSLAACGGGNGAPSQVINGGGGAPLAITPATATAYSGTPFTFLITGGTRPYAILTSDQSALPVVGTLDGDTLVVVPGSVGTDTPATLTVRDSAGQTTSAAVTVRPALLLPASITITGNPNCDCIGVRSLLGAGWHGDGPGDRTCRCTARGSAGAFRCGARCLLDLQHGAGTTPGAVVDRHDRSERQCDGATRRAGQCRDADRDDPRNRRHGRQQRRRPVHDRPVHQRQLGAVGNPDGRHDFHRARYRSIAATAPARRSTSSAERRPIRSQPTSRPRSTSAARRCNEAAAGSRSRQRVSA